mmetsp:Transcript_11270/g.39266  ORF Transcript_11270/g.39266 Transcript_11270/m.39266 type:complete len:314 (+) Transcript_11270:337-1278(+)
MPHPQAPLQRLALALACRQFALQRLHHHLQHLHLRLQRLGAATAAARGRPLRRRQVARVRRSAPVRRLARRLHVALVTLLFGGRLARARLGRRALRLGSAKLVEEALRTSALHARVLRRRNRRTALARRLLLRGQRSQARRLGLSLGLCEVLPDLGGVARGVVERALERREAGLRDLGRRARGVRRRLRRRRAVVGALDGLTRVGLGGLSFAAPRLLAAAQLLLELPHARLQLGHARRRLLGVAQVALQRVGAPLLLLAQPRLGGRQAPRVAQRLLQLGPLGRPGLGVTRGLRRRRADARLKRADLACRRVRL